jgi:hypothetical protein
MVLFCADTGSIGYARIRVISTSKIRNSNATKKNWNEKGIWGGVIMLKPHSNCLHFSLYDASFFLTVFVATPMAKMMAKEVIITTVIFIFYVSF